MIKKTPPSYNLLRNIVTLLGGRVDAFTLYHELTILNYERQAIQLAMQRAYDDGALKVNKDWTITNG